MSSSLIVPRAKANVSMTTTRRRKGRMSRAEGDEDEVTGGQRREAGLLVGGLARQRLIAKRGRTASQTGTSPYYVGTHSRHLVAAAASLFRAPSLAPLRVLRPPTNQPTLADRFALSPSRECSSRDPVRRGPPRFISFSPWCRVLYARAFTRVAGSG